MSIPERAVLTTCLAAAVAGIGYAGTVVDSPRLGRPATLADVARADLTVAGDGIGLPPGEGSARDGRATFAAKCQACHGVDGAGGLADRLTGGVGTLQSSKPIRTVTSYWPYAQTAFDYIRRAMPLNAPQSLTDNEVYGLIAYLLSVDGLVEKSATLDARSLMKIEMPNRRGFDSLRQRDFDGDQRADR